MISIYEKLGITDNVAITIISIALMLFIGFLMTRITKKLHLPNVTAYIVAGIIIGPSVLKLVPQSIVNGMDFLSDIALAFIAFNTGEFFKFSILKKNGLKVIIITIFESLVASFLVFIVMYFILKLPFDFSVVLGALAAATAPASTMMTIRQTNSKGDFVDTLVQVVALDDVVGLIAYSVAIALVLATKSDEKFQFVNILVPIAKNLLTLILGALFGFILKLLMPKKRSKDNRLIVSISLIFMLCGICAMMHESPLLACMAMGMIYINISEDEKLFMQLNYFTPPILLLFFVRSGCDFQLNALFGSSLSLNSSIPLIAIGIIYFFVRIVGKYLGSFLGCLTVKKDKSVRNYLGLALIPQAGVAIGLAALGARTLGGDDGEALNTIILASSVLYELIGPACAKLSLYLSKSYDTKNEATSQEEIINNSVDKHDINVLEEAFTQAAEEHFQNNSRKEI